MSTPPAGHVRVGVQVDPRIAAALRLRSALRGRQASLGSVAAEILASLPEGPVQPFPGGRDRERLLLTLPVALVERLTERTRTMQPLPVRRLPGARLNSLNTLVEAALAAELLDENTLKSPSNSH